MRKLLLLPMIAVLFGAGFCAFGDTVRGGRSIANSMNSSEPTAEKTSEKTAEKTNEAEKNTGAVAARAANRNRAKQVNNTTTARVATRTTAARSAKKTTSAPNTGAVAARAARNVAPAKTSGVVAARAGAKQKAVNMGTKVATANENTMVPQECQDSFYGCMDSLCMLENVSGGRCRCDDRSVELDKVLDQIIKLDAQSKVLAEEGVERLERGKDVDEIYAMADKASDKVLADHKKGDKDLLKGVDGSTKNKSKTLDLSAFNTNLFDTDSFGDGGEGGMEILGADLADKIGSDLRDAALKMCASKVPQQCNEYGSMLQLVYAQKIKSDCIAYENDLKQQHMNSQNLLKAAKKAVRDAAGEAFNKANKYKTVGECAAAYRQCMIGDGVCGAGFSNCIVNKVVVSKSAAKMQQIKTGSTVIEIEATTYDTINNKRTMCDTVLEECEKVSSGVWDEFLKMIAPELKSAEFAAEDDQRRNCGKNIVNCVKEAASAEGLQEGTDSWYIFTSDPKNIQRICKQKIEQCNAYDDATNSLSQSVLNYVVLALNAIRADRCTTSIKKCLEKDTVCHEDYSGCLGVDMNFLWNSCADTIKPDCVGREDIKTEADLKGYISQVASGVLQNADNQIAEQCRKALEKAMNEVCGSTTSCQNNLMEVAQIDLLFNYAICPGNKSDVTDSIDSSCIRSAEALSSYDATKAKNWRPLFYATVNPKKISFDEMLGKQGEFKSTQNDNMSTVDGLVKTLNNNFTNIYNSITSLENIKACTGGQDAMGFDGKKLSESNKRSEGAKVFPNLTANARQIVAAGVYNAYLSQYYAAEQTYKDRRATDAATIAKLYATTTADKEKACKDLGKQYDDTGVKKEDLQTVGATANWLDSAVYDGNNCIINYHYATCERWYTNDSGGTTYIYDEGSATKTFSI